MTLIVLIFSKNRLLTGLTGLIFFFFSGILLAHLNSLNNHPAHYTQFQFASSKAIGGSVVSDVLVKEKYYRYDIALTTMLTADQEIACAGKIHLYVRRDTSTVPFNYGDMLLVNHGISAIPPPKNPVEFDYKIYSEKMGVYAQTFVDNTAIEIIGHQVPNRLMGWIINQRNRIKEIINVTIVQVRERQIAQALFIGIKNELDMETKQAYAAAGAMHVLAVSGLHVGIVYMIIAFCLKPVKRFPLGSLVFVGGGIVSLWLYAMLTGLSPSVMRAATMFSLIALKDFNLKSSNIYNSLGIAAFVLLLYDPNFIYSVGFQLSFIAVFGIVYFYPRIYPVFIVNNWLLDKIWSITAISIAAQLSTFPLTVYYFHQFPTYFFISNLFVIPGATILLIAGLPMLTVGLFSLELAKILGIVVEKIIYFMNAGVFWVEKIPMSLVTWLYFDPWQTLFCYAAIILIFIAIDHRSFTALISGVLSITMIFFIANWSYWRDSHQSKLVIYEIKDKLAIDLIEGKNAKLLLRDFQENELDLLKYQIDPYRLASGLPPIDHTILSTTDTLVSLHTDHFELLDWHDKKIGILKSDFRPGKIQGQWQLDVLILQRNSKIDLEKIMSNISIKEVVVASDCSSWYARNIEQTCMKLGIPVHYVSRDGYWIVDLS